MEEQATDRPDVARHDSQQDELRVPSGHASEVTREAVLSHTGEVFEALQQKASPSGCDAVPQRSCKCSSCCCCGHAAADSMADQSEPVSTYCKQVQELNAQLDGSRGGAGNGFSSPSHPDALVGYGEEGGSSASPTTPDGQSAPRPAAATYTPEVEECVRQVWR